MSQSVVFIRLSKNQNNIEFFISEGVVTRETDSVIVGYRPDNRYDDNKYHFQLNKGKLNQVVSPPFGQSVAHMEAYTTIVDKELIPQMKQKMLEHLQGLIRVESNRVSEAERIVNDFAKEMVHLDTVPGTEEE